MRLLVHDFAGYSFPVQLSRKLAERGHRVLHLSARGLPGPKGKIADGANSPGLEVRGVRLSHHFRKYSPWRRLITQWQYGQNLRAVLEEENPDVVLSADTPIDVQASLLRSCRRQSAGFAHWVQDDYSLALDFVLRPKIGAGVALAVMPFRWLDGWTARHSDAVVSISPDFLPHLRRLGAREDTMVVIENWAPLDENPLLGRKNPWSDAHALNDKPVFLYSGSMGLKHRPERIYRLAEAVAGKADVVVASEGVGRQYLTDQPRLSNLILLDFQPYEKLPEMLATADVLLATLEEDAGAFAVPSKVLTYLCAGRAILLTAPLQNLASEVVRRSGGGVVIPPDDKAAWISAANTLLDDPEWRASLGLRARQYAEDHFDIEKITDRFEAVLTKVAERRSTDESTASHNGPISVVLHRWFWGSA